MRRARLVTTAIILATAATAACGSPAGKATPTPSPASPAPTAAQSPGIGRVQLPSGTVYRVELAKTPEEQAQGLMFRESLPDRAGMLFVFPEVAVHKFWMKNTMIPLDMVWMDAIGKVLFVSADTPPCKADPCPNYGPDEPAASVLEIAGGMAAKEKIARGTTVLFLK